MQTITRPDTSEHVIDGTLAFTDSPFIAEARRAAEHGATVVAVVPAVPLARSLSGTTRALLDVFAEQHIRQALWRAGFSQIERRQASDGRITLVASG